MYTVRFRISISAEEMLRWYRGEVFSVMVTADSGLLVQVPARALQPFVTPDGVHGRFVMQHNGRGKLVSLRRAAEPRQRGRVV